MKAFFKEFRQFISRGNVIDLAVGVMIGTAFSKITTSLVNDVFMPLLSLVIGRLNLAQELVCVPDFTGLGDVDAVRMGRLRGLEITLTGTGICVGQTPAAGEYVAPGATVEVIMDPLAGPDV